MSDSEILNKMAKDADGGRLCRCDETAAAMSDDVTRESSGGATSYYTVRIDNPASLNDPYSAECLDIIEALDMSFVAGEAFKAIWRLFAARSVGKGKEGGSALYDAQKAEFYGHRMAEVERHRKE